MDFEFNEEQLMLRSAIRDFVKAEIAPLVDEAEKNEKCPLDLFPKMGELGYLCIWASEEYGGSGMGRVEECIINEELAYCDMGIAELLVSSHPDGAEVVGKYGNEDQMQRFVVPAVKGTKIAAIAATEPEAGSDMAANKTTAIRDGNDYILNGSKIFITGGTVADFISVLAVTDASKGPKERMSIIVVEKGTPGFTPSLLHPVGQRPGDIAELAFDNCRVPAENLVGVEGRGFAMMMDVLAGCRVNHAARSVGMAQAAFDVAVEYAKTRKTFGQPIARHQSIEFKLATMAMELEAARLMVYQAAWLQDEGKSYRTETSMAKLFAAEVVRNVTKEAVHIQGGYGLMMESPLQRFWRDSEFQAVTEGTLEMLMMTIGKQLFR